METVDKIRQGDDSTNGKIFFPPKNVIRKIYEKKKNMNLYSCIRRNKNRQ